MRFQDIPGLEKVKEKLIQSVRNDKLSHAILFAGDAGSWTLPLSLALATYVNCENPGMDACGECSSCQQNSRFVHPDLNFVFPLTSQPKVKSEDLISTNFLNPWRSFLAEGTFQELEDWARIIDGENKPFNISKEESRQIIKNLSLKAFTGKYKVMLIWLPEYMHINAANGILKVLEEPTENTLFILASQNSERLLGTILSRTRQIRVRKPKISEVSEWLMKYEGATEGEAQKASRLADGNVNTAKKHRVNGGEGVNDFFREWLLACYGTRIEQMNMFTDDFRKMSKVSQKAFFQYGQHILRDCLTMQTGTLEQENLQGEYRDFIQKLSGLLNADKIELFSGLFNHSYYMLERNVNAKIAFLNMSLKVNAILRG